MMEQQDQQGLPTLPANVQRLQRELQDLHNSVKSTGGEHQDQAATSAAGGMVIKGK
jgi:peptidoglycan hydrolase CwlO-like protein